MVNASCFLSKLENRQRFVLPPLLRKTVLEVLTKALVEKKKKKGMKNIQTEKEETKLSLYLGKIVAI